MSHTKRIFMLAYLVAFALADTSTALSLQYPALEWLGLVGVLAVLVEAGRCARYRWSRLRRGPSA